jgi:hypothetical protein
MIYGDEQARAKWCPFALTKDVNSRTAVNRWVTRGAGAPNDIGPCHCMGSKCGVWLGTPENGRCGLTQKS